MNFKAGDIIILSFGGKRRFAVANDNYAFEIHRGYKYTKLFRDEKNELNYYTDYPLIADKQNSLDKDSFVQLDTKYFISDFAYMFSKIGEFSNENVDSFNRACDRFEKHNKVKEMNFFNIKKQNELIEDVLESIENDDGKELTELLKSNDIFEFRYLEKPLLIDACEHGSKKCVQALLDSGEYVNQVDSFLRTGISIAENSNNRALKKVLEKAGAVSEKREPAKKKKEKAESREVGKNENIYR